MDERLVEEAIVVAVGEGPEGRVDLLLVAGEGCEACSARLICRPDDGDKRRLRLRSPRPLQPGDRVQVEVGGGRVLAAAGLLYGLPLAGFLAGLLLAWRLLPPTAAREALAFLAGLAGVALGWGWARLRLRDAGDDWLGARVL
jgi:positive regulator of sigma E activity